MSRPDTVASSLNFLARRKIITGLAGMMTAASSVPALAQFGFSFGGGSDDDKRGVLDLNRLFSGAKSLFDGFSLDEKDEVGIGTKLYPKLIDRSGGAYANRRAQRGLQLFTEELTAASERKDLPWEVVVVNNNTVNAWALPGGKLAIHKGLLRYTSNATELAAVICHEIGHVELSHGLSQMKTEEFTSGLTDIARATILKQEGKSIANDLVLDMVDEKLFDMVTTGYSKEREFEADLHILKLFEKTGHDPAKATGFFKTLLQIIPPGAEGTTSLFSTHPGTEERIEKIQEAASEMSAPDPVAQAQGFDVIKRYFPNRRKYRRAG